MHSLQPTPLLKSLPKLPVSLAVLSLLVSCATGPEYKKPEVAIPASYLNAASSSDSPSNTAIADFWRGFSDVELDRLVQLSLEANADLRLARSRLVEARAELNLTNSQSYPTIGLDANVTRSMSSQVFQPGTSRSQRTSTIYSPAAVLNWELDLFGRQQRSNESAAALVSAADITIGQVQAALVAEVVRNYLQLRGLQQRIDLTQKALDKQKEVLNLTQMRLASGRGNQLDVESASTLVASTTASLPALQIQLNRAINRMATLSAQSPGVLAQTLLKVAHANASIPNLPVSDLSLLPVGAPEAMLKRRPDILVAERQLASASAQVGVAMANRFPRISLSGLLGLSTNSLDTLSPNRAGTYSLGANLSWTAFDFGRNKANVNAAEARLEQSLVSYQKTIQVALEETENALSGFNLGAEQNRALTSAASSSGGAAGLARVRYIAGASDLLLVLDAERQALLAQDQVVQSQIGQSTALVEVYRALGGGWKN
jgi:outer membrane protein, multidrug efflux system